MSYNKTQEALKMAIEAMEMAMEADWELNKSHVFNILHSITVCKEALAEHEAWQKQIQYAKAHITKQQMMENNPLSGQYKGGRFDD